MELVIETLADYIYAILNSNLDLKNAAILYEAAMHDREGVKIRLPCNAFFVVLTHYSASRNTTLHGLLRSPPETIYYCIGTKPNAYLSEPWMETFQSVASKNPNREIFEKNDIAADLAHHCGFDDTGSYTEEEALDNQKTVMHHFKTLAKFANQNGYVSLKRRKRASQENEGKAKVTELAALITPLIDMRIANKPKLSKEGIVRLKRVIQEPLNIDRAKHPLARSGSVDQHPRPLIVAYR